MLMRGLLAILVCIFFVGTVMAAPINDSSDAALMGATVINFESEASGVYNLLTVAGVTFYGNDGSFSISSAFSGSYSASGLSLQNTLSGASSFTFLFSSTVESFGFNWGASNEDWLLSAYNASDALLESYLLPQTWYSNDDFFGLAVDSIAYATLVQLTHENDANTDYTLLDNFSYVQSENAPVPEPSTLLLLGAGIAGLAAYRRKKS